MKVHLIKEQFDSFTKYLTNRDYRVREIYLYQIISNFHQSWTRDKDLVNRIEESLQSEVSRRLWHRENHNAKKMMLQFAAEQPDYCDQMIKDLFDESRSIDARIDRYKFYCDELFLMHKSANPRSIETSHDQDAPMISLYLAGKYPNEYAIYPGLAIFSKALKAFGSPNLPVVDDLERYFKVCKAIQTLAQKESNLWQQHSDRFSSEPDQIQYKQFSAEFIAFVGHSSSQV